MRVCVCVLRLMPTASLTETTERNRSTNQMAPLLRLRKGCFYSNNKVRKQINGAGCQLFDSEVELDAGWRSAQRATSVLCGWTPRLITLASHNLNKGEVQTKLY